MKKKCLLSGNFALDTIVTRDYPNGFIVGDFGACVKSLSAST